MRRHPWLTVAIALTAAALAAFVVLYFAPQDLFIDTSISEPVPTATAAPSIRPTTSPLTNAPTVTAAPPIVLAHGAFRSGEHKTTGTARLLKVADGRTFVRLEDLDTSNGPDVRIWLSAADAHASDGTVHSSEYVDLGGLKANHGNQNYPVPAGTDLTPLRSVVVWCRRFEVVFGAAPLGAR